FPKPTAEPATAKIKPIFENLEFKIYNLVLKNYFKVLLKQKKF
ncbi:hypothetical protein cco19_08008, partial [Campylobacter coli 1091]